MELLIKDARIYQDGAFVPGDLLIRDGKIAAVGAGLSAPEAQVLPAQGRYCVPGFLDIHTHGGMNVDVNAATEEDLVTLARFFASHGTTGFLTSVLTDTQEQTELCIDRITRAMAAPTGGARILGIHLEGPFLASAYKGAMPEELLRRGDADWVRACQARSGGAIRYITVSPEVEGVPELVSAISGEIAVAMGHSGAGYDAAMDCVKRGVRSTTHTFNAMRLFHQHEPAIMGAALESDVYCEAICDGRHLHPGSVRMLLKCKGYDRVVAVTDSIQAAGLPDGRYKLGVNDVVVEDGDAKLVRDGTRAGSTLTTDQALRNLVKFTGEGLERVLPLLTENPADLLRLPQKGRLRPGADGDAVLLTDELEVAATVVAGEVVYTRA